MQSKKVLAEAEASAKLTTRALSRPGTKRVPHTMEILLTLFVAGLPKPGGSKSYKGRSKRTGKSILVDSSGDAGKNWRHIVSVEAAKAMRSQGLPMLKDVALKASFVFRLPRSKDHLSKKGEGLLVPSAPKHHLQAPDVLKLTRSTEDAMTRVVYQDDSLIVNEEISKEWCLPGKEGCHITIWRIDA